MSMIILCSDTGLTHPGHPGHTSQVTSEECHNNHTSDPQMSDMPLPSPSKLCHPLSLSVWHQCFPSIRGYVTSSGPAVTTQRVARYWSLLHRSIVPGLNMKLRLNSFFSKPLSLLAPPTSVTVGICWKFGGCLVKTLTMSGWSLMAVTDLFVPIISWLIARTQNGQIICSVTQSALSPCVRVSGPRVNI